MGPTTIPAPSSGSADVNGYDDAGARPPDGPNSEHLSAPLTGDADGSDESEPATQAHTEKPDPETHEIGLPELENVMASAEDALDDAVTRSVPVPNPLPHEDDLDNQVTKAVALPEARPELSGGHYEAYPNWTQGQRRSSIPPASGPGHTLAGLGAATVSRTSWPEAMPPPNLQPTVLGGGIPSDPASPLGIRRGQSRQCAGARRRHHYRNFSCWQPG